MEESKMSTTPKRLRITLRQLEVFLAVAKERSTRAAGDVVARSQSAASSALADLEEALGCNLFDRVGRRLILNEYGRNLLPVAASLLEQIADLEDILHAKVAGSPLVIAASMTIGEHILPGLIARWRVTHPRNPVRMLVTNTVGVLDAVAELEASVGFIEGPQTRSGLSLQPWFSDEMVIVAAPTHPLAQRKASHADLRAASWAMREVGSGTREAAERWLTEHLGCMQIDYELGTPQAVTALVMTGLAVGCLPRHAIERSVDAGDLVVVKHDLPEAQRRLTIVTHAAKRPGPTCGAFIQHCLRSASTMTSTPGTVCAEAVLA